MHTSFNARLSHNYTLAISPNEPTSVDAPSPHDAKRPIVVVHFAIHIRLPTWVHFLYNFQIREKVKLSKKTSK